MKRARSIAFLLVAFFLLYATPSFAQVATGTPPFGSFGGGPADTINLGNLNVHIAVPVRNKAGRGIPFTYQLSYDTSVWYPLGSTGDAFWEPVSNWGWNGQTATTTGWVNYGSSPTSCTSGGRQIPYTIYNFWNFTDPYGVVHPFSVTVVSLNGKLRCGLNDYTASTTATDGSGYTFAASGSPSIEAIPPAGGTISPTLNSDTGSGLVIDANGNEITSNGSAITDTLGTTALTMAGSGTPTSPITLTYTAPSGANPSFTVNYQAYTVRTNFGCSGVTEYGPQTIDLVNNITLPDGSSYQFTYEPTPGFSGDYTGRLASVTLPTGGKISYSYSGGSNGIVCADGTAATITRQTPDGTWTYAHSESGTAWTTTITDPQTNKTVLDFQGIYQTEQQVYSGSSTLLKTVFTCYNGAAPNCNSTAITLPIARESVYTQWPSGLESENNLIYNTFGLQTEEDDYDYGSGSPGGLLRKTLISYASLGNGILNRPYQVTVENGSGGIVAQTTYTYDQGTVTPTSGTPQHGAISGSRGNATTISYLVASSTTLSKTFTYFDTGNVQTSQDVNGAVTTLNYADATSTCGNAFPTSASEPLSLSMSMAWNCTGGAATSTTDENGKVTTFTYNDPDFWRTNAVTDTENNTTNFTYASLTSVESTLNFNGSTSTTDILATLDGLGRPLILQKKQSPSASSYDSVETNYDSLGRPSRTTVPYSGASGQTNGSAPATTQTYDALNRPLLTTDGGLGTVTLSFSANDVLQTVGPAPTGENTKQRQSEYNGIGQLTSVCEITSLSGSGTCAQNTSATGYWTKYTYDVLGDLLTVTQDAQSSTAQSRSYAYDGLGRMTSEVNPENGATYYFYDTDPGTKGGANCSGTYDGDLVKRVDAAGNVACYAYDVLHRVTSITYPYGTNSSNTPSKYFVYDSATVNSVAMANAKTRLAETYTCISPCTSKLTDEGLSYTARGEVQDVYESTPHSGGYFHVDETYWANGALEQISGLSGLPTLTYTPDGEGRANSVSAGSGQNPVSSTNYNVASEATQLSLGSSDSDTFSFDPNTFRMTQYQFNVNGQAVTGALTWNPNGSLGKLAITDAFNSANTQTCTYSHDDLARIASGNCGSVWAQTFTYDAFGNIKKSGTSQFQPTYSYATNQMSSIGSFTPTYDSNGDVLNDSLHSYAWDVETRPTTIDTVAVTYDALERMVEQNKSGSYTEIVYAPLGSKLALMSGTSTLKQAFAPLPAGATAVYNASGLAYYRHPDWLGSSRFSSTPSRAMYNDLAFAPFGEPYAQSGNSDTSFTGQNQDTTSNLYDFMYREYGIQGRWPSPDPAGTAAVNPANPQSWNRYTYVFNGPLNFVDPSGLDPVLSCSSSQEGKTDTNHNTCQCDGSGLCFWVPPNNTSVTVNAGPPPLIPPISGPLWPVANPSGNVPGTSPGSGPGGAPGSPQPPVPPQTPAQAPNPQQKQSYGTCVFETAITDSFWSGVGLGGAALVVPPVVMGIAGASIGPEGAFAGAGLGLGIGVGIAPEAAGSGAVDGLAAGALHGAISCAFR